jgi:hypothetical protein
MADGEPERRGDGRAPSRRSLRGLDVLNFTLADVQTGVGPFLAIDTTAVMLTPVVLVIAKRLELPTAPFVAACAFVANVRSSSSPPCSRSRLPRSGSAAR